MKFAFSTNAFTRFTLPEAIQAIGQAGYEGVEILADEPHAYPLRMDAELIRSTVDALAKAKLAVSNVNCNCTFGYWKDAPPEPFFEPSLISPLEKYRKDRIEMIKTSIRFAREIGARNISITTGKMLAHVGPHRAAELLTESLKPVLDEAESQQIDVGFECEPGLYLEYTSELAEWIARLGSARLGANLDVGHSQVIGESIAGSIHRLRGRIWNMHVEGMAGRKHYHLIPGDPMDLLDWSGLKRVIKETEYDRFATVELYTMADDPHRAAEQAMAFLRRL